MSIPRLVLNIRRRGLMGAAAALMVIAWSGSSRSLEVSLPPVRAMLSDSGESSCWLDLIITPSDDEGGLKCTVLMSCTNSGPSIHLDMDGQQCQAFLARSGGESPTTMMSYFNRQGIQVLREGHLVFALDESEPVILHGAFGPSLLPSSTNLDAQATLDVSGPCKIQCVRENNIIIVDEDGKSRPAPDGPPGFCQQAVERLDLRGRHRVDFLGEAEEGGCHGARGGLLSLLALVGCSAIVRRRSRVS